MNEQESYSEEKAAHLLNHLELILESDPLIDEVGFIHPSQFVTLNEEIGQSVPSADDISTTLWSKDHKLGISTHALLPLFKAARREFVDAVRRYKALSDQCGENGVGNSPYTVSSSHSSVESEVMKHSMALLLLSCDFGTAWHSRRWVIKSIAGKCSTLQEIVGKDSELVEKIAERSKMNYRAWNHRNWLVSYMSTDQVLHELTKSRNWAGLYVADNSCFHYRRRLMLRILEDSSHGQENGSTRHNVEIHQLWKKELEWNEMLIKRFIGREALWLHRRFLSLVLIKHFLSDQIGTSMDNDFDVFLNNELQLLRSCSTIPDGEFEDYQAQALHSTTYMLWLVKQIPEFDGIEVQEKLRTDKMKVLLNDACPDRSSLWDYLISEHCQKEN